MLKRLRQLKISLATKCQILFGTAVAAIIFAALFVPWQRMEQLTEQLNEKAAGAVADAVVADHVNRQTALQRWRAAEPPDGAAANGATASGAAVTSAAVNAEPGIDGQDFPAPRLVAASALKTPEKLTKFEQSAMARFIRDPQRRTERRSYETRDGGEGYRYAEALYATSRCIACHAPPAAQTAAMIPPSTMQQATATTITPPTTPPHTTTPAVNTTAATQPARLIGIVSVDLPSQIKSKEVLLNRAFLLIAGLIAGCLAVIIFYLIITRLILDPVRVLQETAEKVSQGDLNIRSDINSGDEFQQLSETFNTMLVNLKSSADQLRAVNKSLDLKLGQLAESNVALYESNRLKSEFLANVSHELRTPLNSILGFADLLKEQTAPAGEPKSLRYLSNIINSGNHLLDLINDLLDLAKIEAGKMEVRSEPLSLPDMFEALVSLLKPLAEQKQLTIAPRVAADLPIVRTDAAKLQQVLYNYLSNAIKFSPPGERVDLIAERAVPDGEAAAETASDSVRLTVIDRGPGIELDKQSLIFEKFRQLDGSVTRQHGGTGLGLAISKELATLLGGSVGVRSAPGEGATFWITIPLAIEPSSQDVRAKLVLT